MSSHHFVKDGQEPALFIADALSLTLIEPLLEWAPFVLVLDTALDAVLNWGIKIDAVLINTAQTEIVTQKIIEQAPVKIFSYQDSEAPVLKGLYHLMDHQKTVHIITHVTDNIFDNVQKVKDINVVLLDEKTKWSYISSLCFEKWLPADSQLAIRRIETNQTFSTNGLANFTENIFMSVADGNVIIKSESAFWIGEKI